MRNDLFVPYTFGTAERKRLDQDGHFVFPGLLSAAACQRLTTALAYIQSLHYTGKPEHEPRRFAAEYNAYLASLIGHPQLLALARAILGPEIRYDHCVALNREPGHKAHAWHAHGYGEEDMPRDLGFVRIFFYVNGFETNDGGLKVVPGSHLYRDRSAGGQTDEELQAGWMDGKQHPQLGAPLEIEALSVPPGTVIAMWTHALHGVSPRVGQDTRWAVVYAYRNPGLPSRARWLSSAFEQRDLPGAEGLMGLY
jgi:hypothetical protein